MSVKMKSINAVVEIINNGERVRGGEVICILPEDGLLEHIKNNTLEDFILEATEGMRLNYGEYIGNVEGYKISDYVNKSNF